MVTTPNMNLILPDVEVTPGPEWATELNTAMSTVDAHDHSPGKGIAVTPAGLNINTDLDINNNNLIDVRTVAFDNPPTFIPTGSDIACLTAYGNELFYIDGLGNVIQITAGGAIDISGIGGITGMGGTTASVVYSNLTKTFTFLQAPASSALIYAGGYNIYQFGFAGNSLGLRVNSTITNWTLTYPDAPPNSSWESSGNNSKPNLKIASTGQLSVDPLAQVLLGSIIPLSQIAGSYICTATTVADLWGYVLCNGQTLVDVSSPLNGQIMPNLNLVLGAPNYLELSNRWIAYTPIIDGATALSSIEVYWRRVFDTLEIRGKFTPSIINGSNVAVSLLTGLGIDANKIDTAMTGLGEVLGRWENSLGLPNAIKSGPILAQLGSSTTKLFFGNDDSFTPPTGPLANYVFPSSGIFYTFFVTGIPIAQWVDLPPNQIKYVIRVK